MPTIYVYLQNEGTDVWVPVSAEHLGDDVYRIVGCPTKDLEPQFGKDTLVRCRAKELSDGEGLVAFEKLGSAEAP